MAKKLAGANKSRHRLLDVVDLNNVIRTHFEVFCFVRLFCSIGFYFNLLVYNSISFQYKSLINAYMHGR